MTTEIIKVPCSSHGEMVCDMSLLGDYEKGLIVSRCGGLFAHAWGKLVGNLWDKLTGGKHYIVIYQWDGETFHSRWRGKYDTQK